MTLEAMRSFLADKENIFVLTGAGVSAASGIPTYRDHLGNWQRSDPIKHLDFLQKPIQRKRYWARSMVGWKHVCAAQPNSSHCGLAKLEAENRIQTLVTQNVDGLHQLAGSSMVVDLHGRLDKVVCLDCQATSSRADLQQRLEIVNPALVNFVATLLPDGDADIDDYDMNSVVVPNCLQCSGTLKPDVVFFGDNVPKARVQEAMNSLSSSDGMLVVGSSLQVYSGFRFCKAASENSIPIACINQGLTRADNLISIKLVMDCNEAFQRL